MGPFVVDASIAAAWCFENESTVETDLLLDSLATTFARVPALFPVEMQSLLRTGERKGRLLPAESAEKWSLLLSLNIQVDPVLTFPPRPILLELARVYGLTPYDAAYFELARRTGLPLATKDAELLTACRACGIELLP